MELIRHRTLSTKSEAMAVPTTPTTPQSTGSNASLAMNATEMTLETFLGEEDSFNLFMLHLSAEFSVNIMLGLIEMHNSKRALFGIFATKIVIRSLTP